MNSVAIVNWEDKEFAERVAYALGRAGYVREEDYESLGVRTTVWTKTAKNNLSGRMIGNDPLEPLRHLPAEVIANCIKSRLATFVPEGTDQWHLDWMATNLAFDLMGKPG